MKRFLIFLMILLGVSCVILCAYADETPCTYAVTSKNNVNIRASATINSESLAKLPWGDTVGVISKETSGTELWYRVRYGNIYGYIRGDLLKFPENDSARVPGIYTPTPTPTPSPVPVTTAQPTAAPVVYGSWQEAYRAFITEGGYKAMISSGGINPASVSGYTFYVRDISQDAVPELMVRADYGIERLDIYTFRNSQVVYVGTLGGDNFFQWIYYFTDTRFPGLYASLGGPGMEIQRCICANGVFRVERVGTTVVRDVNGYQETAGFNDYVGCSEDLKLLLADSEYGYQEPARSPQAFTVNDLVSGGKWDEFNASAFALNAPWDEAKVRNYVASCYRIALGREAGDAEISNWVQMVMNGQMNLKRLPENFILSDEFRNRRLSNEEIVRVLYSLYLQRDPDAGGLANWVQQLNGGVLLETVTAGFADSGEFAANLDRMKK